MLQDPGFSQRIACALAKLHTFQVPEQLAPWHPAEPQLWNQLDKWLNEAESNFSRISVNLALTVKLESFVLS